MNVRCFFFKKRDSNNYSFVNVGQISRIVYQRKLSQVL